jgi:hypothetical protein
MVDGSSLAIKNLLAICVNAISVGTKNALAFECNTKTVYTQDQPQRSYIDFSTQFAASSVYSARSGKQ